MNAASRPAPRIALLLQRPDQGGVERCFVNLARGFCDRGVAVELITLGDERGGPLRQLDPRVGRATLSEASAEALAERLRARPPQALLAAKDADCALAGAAKTRLATPPRLAFCASVNASAQLAGRGAGALKRALRYRTLRRLYRPAELMICVSKGVADDLAGILGRPRASLCVLPNPVVTPELGRLAAAPLDHPWFAAGAPPVLLGAGRLGRIKNFPLLLDAFARVRRRRPCRLLILGDGRQRGALLRQARELGVAEDFQLAGFVDNPYRFMARAALFVLSSRWEGFGNVLVEAMACGTPAVAVDCPSGPAEILDGGRYGALAPPGDPAALAAAIAAALERPPEPALLAAAVRPYTVARSAERYLASLGLSTPLRRSC